MSVEDKVIIKNDSLPGVDMSIKNFELLGSILPTWTYVTKPIWKKLRVTYIGIKQHIQEGDVIQVGKLGTMFRVIKLIKVEGTMRGKGGKIYRIKRADNNLTTDTDIENVSKGDSVRVMGRQNFIDSLDHPWGRDYVEHCPVVYKTTLPCDPTDDEDCNCD